MIVDELADTISIFGQRVYHIIDLRKKITVNNEKESIEHTTTTSDKIFNNIQDSSFSRIHIYINHAVWRKASSVF